MILTCDAEVYVRPRKSADGKLQAYKHITGKNCKLPWDPEDCDVARLQKAIAGIMISSEGVDMGAVILKASSSKSNPGEWTVYINNIPGLLKGDKIPLTGSLLPEVFVKMAEYPNSKAGVNFTMKNPDKQKEDSAKVSDMLVLCSKM